MTWMYHQNQNCQKQNKCMSRTIRMIDFSISTPDATPLHMPRISHCNNTRQDDTSSHLTLLASRFMTLRKRHNAWTLSDLTKVKPHFDSNFYQHDLTTKFQWKGKKESCALNKIFGNNNYYLKVEGIWNFKRY